MAKMTPKNKWDTWDVEHAADTLIKAQAIPDDPRKGFYAAVKVELKSKVEAADKAALEAKTTVRLHNFRKKVNSKG